MSALLLRIAVYAVIAGGIYLGIRSIVRDWRGRFRDLDREQRERDLKQRAAPGVIELKRDQDGVYRPGDKKD